MSEPRSFVEDEDMAAVGLELPLHTVPPVIQIPPNGPLANGESEAVGGDGRGLDIDNFVTLRPPPHPDRTRQTITYGLLLLLGLIIAAYITLPAAHVFTVAESGEVFDRVFTPVLALAGTATGFYFGDPQHRPTRRPRSSTSNRD